MKSESIDSFQYNILYSYILAIIRAITADYVCLSDYFCDDRIHIVKSLVIYHSIYHIIYLCVNFSVL